MIATASAPAAQTSPAIAFAAVRRHLSTLLFAAAGAGFVAFMGAGLAPQQFQATARLTLTQADGGAASPGPLAVSRLQDPRLLLAMAERLKLADRPEFGAEPSAPTLGMRLVQALRPARPQPTAATPEERLAAAVAARLAVTLDRTRGTLEVRFRSSEPQLAADAANDLARAYRATLAATEPNEPALTATMTETANAVIPLGIRKGAAALLAMAATLALGAIAIALAAAGRRPAFRAAPPPAHPAPPRAQTEANPTRITTSAGSSAGNRHGRAASLPLLARHILSRGDAPARAGTQRVLVVGEDGGVDGRLEAVALARTLAAAGAPVLVVEWDREGGTLHEPLGLPPRPGFNDLLEGLASFEDIITPLPGSPAHLLLAGFAALDPATPRLGRPAIDIDHLNLLLDALDDAYGILVLTGTHGAAQELFEGIEGRIDVGVTVVAPAIDRPGRVPPRDSFLGFEVADLEVLTLPRPRSPDRAHVAAPVRMPHLARGQRAGDPPGPESGRCIHHTIQPAGRTQASPATA